MAKRLSRRTAYDYFLAPFLAAFFAPFFIVERAIFFGGWTSGLGSGLSSLRAWVPASLIAVSPVSVGVGRRTAERRARWGTDAVGEGFVRLSAGIEDTEDLLSDISAALDGA